MDAETATTRVLDAADDLFYRHGVHAVGMDDLRAASGVSLKRLYQLFPNKEHLVVAFLARRDTRWRADLRAHAAAVADPRDRVLAVFDRLHDWFGEPTFRGCAWINAFGELGATSPAVTEEIRRHKAEFRALLHELVVGAGLPAALVDPVLLLVEGATVTAAITGSAAPARQAREAMSRLLTTVPA